MKMNAWTVALLNILVIVFFMTGIIGAMNDIPTMISFADSLLKAVIFGVICLSSINYLADQIISWKTVSQILGLAKKLLLGEKYGKDDALLFCALCTVVTGSIGVYYLALWSWDQACLVVGANGFLVALIITVLAIVVIDGLLILRYRKKHAAN